MLTGALRDYFALRRSLGFKLKTEEILLKGLVRFIAARGESHIRAETAIGWASLGPSPSARDKRLRTAAAFATHLRAEDPRHEVPPTGVYARVRNRALPFIFAPDDVRRFIAEAASIGRQGTLDPLTCYTLFGLLFSAGLRISEVLSLRIHDVTGDGLLVRETKFRKSRLVPLHATASAALERYLERRRRLASSHDRLFVTSGRAAPGYKWVFRRFKQILRAIGRFRIPGRRRPRIHDIRHTFAVRALETCPGGDQVQRHILALSTYLGHAHVADTYWYLQATPKVMAELADAGERLERKDRS
jgi:integrase